MLGKLFGSQARVKILKLFLLHPDEEFYIRQIARDLGLQLNSARRELENLEKFGLLISGNELSSQKEEARKKLTKDDFFIQTIKDVKAINERKHNKQAAGELKSDKKYYRVNTDFVLYEEAKALIIKAQILYEKSFVEKLRKIGRPKLLVLTGFFVNESNVPVDLLLVGRINKIKFLKLIKELEKELGREINFTLMDAQEFKYRRDITDIFLYGILEAKKISVIDELGVG